MKLHTAAPSGLNTFTGYGEGYVLVNGQRYEKSLVVLPDRLVTDWAATTFELLQAEHVMALGELGCEVVLLGTGSLLRFPRREWLQCLSSKGIGVEVMDVQAACRTYNILMAEERKVAAALLMG